MGYFPTIDPVHQTLLQCMLETNELLRTHSSKNRVKRPPRRRFSTVTFSFVSKECEDWFAAGDEEDDMSLGIDMTDSLTERVAQLLILIEKQMKSGYNPHKYRPAKKSHRKKSKDKGAGIIIL